MIELVKDFNKAKDTLVEQVQEYIKDKSIPLETRWNTALEAKDLLPNDSYVYHGLDHLVVGREISWYDEFHTDRYATLELLSDDFLEHFVVCSTEKDPVTVYFHEDDWEQEYPIPNKEDAGEGYTTKILSQDEYPEAMYWNPIKVKPGYTIDDIKEAILESGYASFTNDW